MARNKSEAKTILHMAPQQRVTCPNCGPITKLFYVEVGASTYHAEFTSEGKLRVELSECIDLSVSDDYFECAKCERTVEVGSGIIEWG